MQLALVIANNLYIKRKLKEVKVNLDPILLLLKWMKIFMLRLR